MSSSHGSTDQTKVPMSQDDIIYADSLMNLSLLDPSRWGWGAVGSITDVLTPHDVSVLSEVPSNSSFQTSNNFTLIHHSGHTDVALRLPFAK